MNFIPVNKVDGLDYRRPSSERTAFMAHTLASAWHPRQDTAFSRTGDRRGVRTVARTCSESMSHSSNTYLPHEKKLPRPRLRSRCWSHSSPFAGTTSMCQPARKNLRPPLPRSRRRVSWFDTESKPTFSPAMSVKGRTWCNLPCTTRPIFFNCIGRTGLPFLIELLHRDRSSRLASASNRIAGHIHAKLGVHFNAVVDLNTVFSRDGHHKEMGVRAAVGCVEAALCQGQACDHLQLVATPTHTQQMLYAANDAYAALKVLEVLDLPRADLPIMGLSQPKQYSDKANTLE